MNDIVDIQYPACNSLPSSNTDHIIEYAKETLTLGLMLLEFKDSLREGDGERVLRCWKFLMLYFRSSGHANYCFESLTY